MGLRVEKIKIEPELKEKIESTIKRKKLEITYYNGYLVKFDKCNLESINLTKY